MSLQRLNAATDGKPATALMRGSVQRRLVLTFAALSCVLLLCFGIAYLWSIWSLRDNEDLDSLTELVREIVDDAIRLPDGSIDLRMDEAELTSHRTIPGFEALVLDMQTGQVVWVTPASAEPRLRPLAEAKFRRIYATEQGKAPHDPLVRQTLAVQMRSGAGPLRVVVSRDGVPPGVASWLARKTSTVVLPIIVPLLIFVTLLGAYTVRRALKPVAQVAQEANRIGAASLNKRLDTTNVPREVRPLVNAVNRALARLDQAFQEQRRFTATAAHELRTPIALLLARIEGMDDRLLAEDLKRDIARLTRVVEQLLAVARLDSRLGLERVEIDVVAAAREVVSRLTPLAIAHGREIALIAGDRPLTINADRDALEAAIRNLVENALRFTAPGTAVEVTVERSGADAVIEVRDRGPGVPIADRKQIFARFWTRRNSGGSGLGLAIVSEIAALHGGSIAVNDNPGGGAAFRLALPQAPTQIAA